MSEPLTRPAMSIVVCTYNPREDFLSEALSAIGAQDRLADCELIIVDNNSNPPLEQDRLEALAGRTVKLVRQPRQGLTWARCAGIAAARGHWVCFVDDDNILAPGYLDAAIHIARKNPRLGVFGGKALGRLEKTPSALVRYYLPFLGVRDLGEDAITGPADQWHNYEPIGAGMVARMAVCEAFVAFCEQTDGAFGLGRSGKALLSGEDSLFSRIADRMGYEVGYFPKLSLDHVMPAARLNRRYIFQMLSGQGRTHVILEAIAGRSCAAPNERLVRAQLARFLHRTRTPGLVEAIGHWHWDRGYFEECGSKTARLAQDKGPEALDAVAAQHERQRRGA